MGTNQALSFLLILASIIPKKYKNTVHYVSKYESECSCIKTKDKSTAGLVIITTNGRYIKALMEKEDK